MFLQVGPYLFFLGGCLLQSGDDDVSGLLEYCVSVEHELILTDHGTQLLQFGQLSQLSYVVICFSHQSNDQVEEDDLYQYGVQEEHKPLKLPCKVCIIGACLEVSDTCLIGIDQRMHEVYSCEQRCVVINYVLVLSQNEECLPESHHCKEECNSKGKYVYYYLYYHSYELCCRSEQSHEVEQLHPKNQDTRTSKWPHSGCWYISKIANYE
jgi:hypothetical protein